MLRALAEHRISLLQDLLDSMPIGPRQRKELLQGSGMDETTPLEHFLLPFSELLIKSRLNANLTSRVQVLYEVSLGAASALVTFLVPLFEGSEGLSSSVARQLSSASTQRQSSSRMRQRGSTPMSKSAKSPKESELRPHSTPLSKDVQVSSESDGSRLFARRVLPPLWTVGSAAGPTASDQLLSSHAQKTLFSPKSWKIAPEPLLVLDSSKQATLVSCVNSSTDFDLGQTTAAGYTSTTTNSQPDLYRNLTKLNFVDQSAEEGREKEDGDAGKGERDVGESGSGESSKWLREHTDFGESKDGDDSSAIFDMSPLAAVQMESYAQLESASKIIPYVNELGSPELSDIEDDARQYRKSSARYPEYASTDNSQGKSVPAHPVGFTQPAQVSVPKTPSRVISSRIKMKSAGGSRNRNNNSQEKGASVNTSVVTGVDELDGVAWIGTDSPAGTASGPRDSVIASSSQRPVASNRSSTARPSSTPHRSRRSLSNKALAALRSTGGPSPPVQEYLQSRNSGELSSYEGDVQEV